MSGIPIEVIHFKGNSLGSQIPEEHRQELCTWVASLGADPNHALPEFCILHHDGGYQLHLSVKVQVNGHDVIDEAVNRVWSEPVVIPLGTEPTWPKWLNDTHERDERSHWPSA